MIAWSQQYRIISNVYNSFHLNEIKRDENPFNMKELERNKIFLRPEKYQDYTLSNFKILVIYTMWRYFPSSKIQFLKILNSFNKQNILEFRKFKQDVISFGYILEKDKKTLETLSINIYEAYKRDLINIFTLGYIGSSEQLGIIGNRELQKAQMLVKFFNFKEKLSNLL